MDLIALIQVCKSAYLADLGSFTRQGANQLVVIEHTYQAVAAVDNFHQEATRWTFWAWRPPFGEWGKTAIESLPLPTASALAINFAPGHFAVLAEINQSAPACLLQAPLQKDQWLPPRPDTLVLQPVQLPQAAVAQVRLNPAQTWSAIGVPCEAWLFNPSMLAAPEAGHFYLSCNTADARGLIFAAPPKPGPSPVFASAPDFLEPVLVATGKRFLWFGRQSPAEWSVFFHNVRFSGQHGPVALPLGMAELDADGQRIYQRDLGQSATGEIFLFAAASDGGNQVALATVAGSKSQPKLLLYQSKDAAHRFACIGQAALTQVPWRLTLAMSGSRWLVACALRTDTGHEVWAAEIAVPP